MLNTVSYLNTLAANTSAPATVIAVPVEATKMEIRVAALYGATTATGLTATLTVSQDGTTFVPSKIGPQTLTLTAPGVAQASFVVPVSCNNPYKQDAGSIAAIGVGLTNNDATHVASVVVVSQDNAKNSF